MTDYADYIVQLLPATDWGLVVWCADDAEATCEPLIAWALTEQVVVGAFTSDFDADAEDAYDHHFPRRHEREMQPVILWKDRPVTRGDLRRQRDTYDVEILGLDRMADFRPSRWAESVARVGAHRQHQDERALQLAVDYVRDHPGASQVDVLAAVERAHVPGMAFNRATAANPNTLERRAVGRDPSNPRRWEWHWWLPADAPAADASELPAINVR